MWMTWRSILPSILILTVVLPLYPLGPMPSLQEPSSGATSTKHDSVIKGLVINESHQPVKNAYVRLTNLATEEWRVMQTDKSGDFQFSELYSGKYRLEVETKTGQRASYEVSLGGSETVVRNFTFKDSGPTASASSGATSSKHHAVIMGKVTGANGELQKYVQVTLINLDTEEKKAMQTDKSGDFQFSELYSGKYRLEVETKTGQRASYEVSLGSGETVFRKLVMKRQE